MKPRTASFDTFFEDFETARGRNGLGLLDGVGVVLFDALREEWVTRASGKPRSRFAGIDVARLLQAVHRDRRPRAIAYSGSMSDPAIAIPLWELRDVVAARYSWDTLFVEENENGEKIAVEVVRDRSTRFSEADPTSDDYAQLHLAPGSKLVDLVKGLEMHDDRWRAVVHNQISEERYAAIYHGIRNLGSATLRFPDARKMIGLPEILGVAREVTRLGKEYRGSNLKRVKVPDPHVWS